VVGDVDGDCVAGHGPGVMFAREISPQDHRGLRGDHQQASVSVEASGSYSHATDTQFCSTHQCIENFPNGSGYIVQCVDGEWSHSGGLSGACSDHGGEG
jgi:hypothetical protein